MNNADTSAVAHLKKNAEEGSYESYLQARQWSTIYYLSRGSLILFSGLTSAKAVGGISYLDYGQPIFALLVTLITGFDVWLKPGAKYRALYIANDEYVELGQKLALVRPDETKKLETLSEEYRQINLRLRNAITP